MKILYHHRIASKDGQFVHVEELTNALGEAGHEIMFVAPKFTKKSDFGSDGGFVSELKSKLPQWLYELMELSYSVIVLFKLVFAILKFKPDFIYERYNLFQPAGVIVAKVFRLPLLLEVNAPLVDERLRHSGLALQKMARHIENFTWRQAAWVLPVSEVLKKYVEKAGVQQERIFVIHNGINQSLLDAELSEKEEFDYSDISIGFVGFINPWHRLDLAIKALAASSKPNVKLVCIGDGEVRPELEELAAELGVAQQVEFTGLLPRSEVFKWVASFDIALQPAVTDYASPLKLFEYMSASCLIIAPDSDNIREIVDDESCLFFDKNNDEDFEIKLENGVSRLQDYETLRQSARERIFSKGFTWQDNARKVIELARARH